MELLEVMLVFFLSREVDGWWCEGSHTVCVFSFVLGTMLSGDLKQLLMKVKAQSKSGHWLACLSNCMAD